MGPGEYGLKSLADDQLLAGLASIAVRRNQITAEFLAYLAELDERQLFLDLGYSSLFEYCVEKLKLCESTAGRHIAAARVCCDHPEVFEMVASGALHASALSLLRKYVTPKNAAELFELCMHHSARKVEQLLATRFPRPDVQNLVRRLPARAQTLNVESSVPARTEINLGCSEEQPAAAEPQRAPTESTHEASVAPKTADASKPRRLEPLSADRYGVHFTADGEFCELLERVRGLAGHRLPSGDLMTLLKRGLEAYERELEKERFAVGRRSRTNRSAAPESRELAQREPTTAVLQNESRTDKKRTLRCSAAVKRAVFLRDGKRCSYVSAEGRRCDARRCLELDHIDPKAVGGEDTIENLRLRCRAHNQRYARLYYGVAHVAAAMEHARRRRQRIETDHRR